MLSPQINIHVRSITPVYPEVAVEFLGGPLQEQPKPPDTNSLTSEMIKSDGKLYDVRNMFIEYWNLNTEESLNFRAGYAIGFKILKIQAKLVSIKGLPRTNPDVSRLYIHELKDGSIDEEQFMKEHENQIRDKDGVFYGIVHGFADRTTDALDLKKRFDIRLGAVALYDLLDFQHRTRVFEQRFNY